MLVLTSLRSREWRAPLIMVLVVEIVALIYATTIDHHNHIDAEVYQLGARAWLDGLHLYGPLPPTESGYQLPFIYPPFAALLFAPLAVLSKQQVIKVTVVVTTLALVASLALVVNASKALAPRRDQVLPITACLLPVATIAEPVLETYGYGQISVLLMAMVLVDCLWRTGEGRKLPWPRGLMLGIAAGIKLTPAAFLLFFLLRRDFRSIAWSFAGFAATVAIGLAASVPDSITFWTHEVFTIGTTSFGKEFAGNVSVFAGNLTLHSMLAKFGLTGLALTAAFGLCAVVVLTLAGLGMVQALRERDLAFAVMINAIAELLLSQVSWSHHWVWAVPTLAMLTAAAVRNRQLSLAVPTAFASAVFAYGPQWQIPAGNGAELKWTFRQQLVANSYVYLGLAFLVYAATFWWVAHRNREQPSVDNPEPVGEEVATSR